MPRDKILHSRELFREDQRKYRTEVKKEFKITWSNFCSSIYDVHRSAVSRALSRSYTQPSQGHCYMFTRIKKSDSILNVKVDVTKTEFNLEPKIKLLF